MQDIEYITSRQNPKILAAIRLKDRREREERQEFAFEGKKLFAEAVRRALPLSAVYATEKNLPFCRELLETGSQDPAVFCVSDAVYEKLTNEKAPEGIFVVAKTIDKRKKIVTIYKSDPFLPPGRRAILSSIRDPGNLGTVIRTATAFGLAELILSADCADIYNSKTVRASMGTLFSLPITVVEDLPGSIAALRREGIPVYATALREDAVSLTSLPADSLRRAVFVLGNEGHGLSAEIIGGCDGAVIIPMTPDAESLNASAAATVLFWEQWKH